jgi:hypothetical protein
MNLELDAALDAAKTAMRLHKGGICPLNPAAGRLIGQSRTVFFDEGFFAKCWYCHVIAPGESVVRLWLTKSSSFRDSLTKVRQNKKRPKHPVRDVLDVDVQT